MLNNDFAKLYQLQDKFLDFWKNLNQNFYLTGGTALGRFYLNHRYSMDLDFFTNADEHFQKNIQLIYSQATKHFNVQSAQSVIYEDFARFYIYNDTLALKIELVNDTAYRTGSPLPVRFGYIDTPINILSNKLSALLGRDEPKDVYDIIHLSLHYGFNWKTIFMEAKNKLLMNEIDVEQKINTFPVELFDGLQWFIKVPDIALYAQYIKTIANDFIIGTDNSLCKTGLDILAARPLLN